MGNSYNRNMSGWNNGPTPYGCTATQDNLSIITTQNGFTYRPDDFSDAITGSPTQISLSPVPVSGIITTSTDLDAFQFSIAANSNVHIDISPFSIATNNNGADLDVKVTLYNSAKTLINTYDPTDKMNVTIDTILNADSYYMVVQGAGNSNATDYGSLGSYTITGVQGTLPIRQILLTGKAEKNKHSLNWTIIADEPIKSVTIESSLTGNNFSTLATVDGATNGYAYAPFQRGDVYYRLKVTSILNQTMYSNVIVLKDGVKAIPDFTVSTFVHSLLTITSTGNYQYRLNDINGNTLSAGSGRQGINQLNMDNRPSGVYVLQLANNNQQQTERIIKQ
jgi:hypothetical protein